MSIATGIDVWSFINDVTDRPTDRPTGGGGRRIHGRKRRKLVGVVFSWNGLKVRVVFTSSLHELATRREGV